ncbi:Stage V sporulation protein D [Borrelia miyamotoi]|uniref:Penicillin-binding protein n=2 Tax=Borrelia miyamotoi TaxID=47466 RepID=A0AAP8YWQ4_9SPIR|nr:penicillin-binding protein [Borrelia miyamotoi]AHH05279.1 Division specific D,D-transpeptidase [Borrelia miyamotoi FR64b]ATQ15044.1 penicillin-binding protein [Borrelia miyamotoi]ATQ16227.1 penicillin-binding protein [Borrelia miyamotoi]ATQ17372.1 penicillin-binding protein [Borrelia miyamotoi]ATQ18126.1 penicillin-binding protein [Borrelia miyamotoi]
MRKNFASNLRLNIVLIAFLIITLLTIYKYFMLMSSKDIPYFNQNINYISRRGNIYDRNGKIIAFSSKSHSIGTYPNKIKNIVSISETLGAILKIDPQTLKKKLSSKKGFTYIKRKVTREESELIKRIQSEGRLKDIILYPDYTRIYPFKELTSNITGFVGTDNIGLEGLELSLNSILNGDLTKQKSINEKLSTNNIYLTIDIDLQKNINQIAKKYFKENQPENMIAIVMDAKNGEILSMLQLPQYDANYYSNYSKEIWHNFATSLTYEPGSINKIFTVAILLDSGLLKSNEKFLDNGVYQKKFKSGEIVTIKTLNPPYDYINPSGILIYSSNVGIAHITDKVSNEYFYNKLIDFGFGEKVGFPFPGETKGLLTHYSKWSGRSKATIGFGQEIGVSAIQILQAASILSNNGIMLKPKIIKKISDEMENTIQKFQKEEIKKVISTNTAKKVLKMMQEVVNKGGIPKLKMKNLSISAKSGTSQVIDKNTGKYSEEDYTSSILVIYPTENPKYIIYIVYRYPKKIIYGTRIAAPMAKEIIELIEHRNNKNAYNEIKISSRISISKPTIKYEKTGALPNFTGVSKRDLIKILKNYKNIKIKVNGNGFVYKQSHPPNTKLKDINELEITLK